MPDIIYESGHIQDRDTGLYIPATYRRHRQAEASVDYLPAPTSVNFSAGVVLDRDEETLVVRWPEKGSGLDDIVCEAIIDGKVANVGIAPVISPQITALLRRQQDQAATATFELSGRKSPVKKAKDAIARFNDSPLGIADGVKLMVHHLRTFNRGCPIATVPITYDTDQWESYGLNLIPIEGTKKYYLDVDWAKHGTPIPFLPSIYKVEPTGNYEFPYWYLTKVDDKWSWVLLHKTQIFPMTPGATRKYGIGTSAIWMILGSLAEEILVMDARIEKQLNSLTDGIVVLAGFETTPKQVKEQIKREREENKAGGYLINKGTTFLQTNNPDAKYIAINFRQDDGINHKDRKEHFEDVIAICFSEPLSSVVTRGGIGYGAQADTIASGSADTGVGALLHQIGTTLGAIYPRVTININRPNDLMQRLNIETFANFASAIQSLPPDTLTRDEIRAIIDTTIIPIPVIEEDFVTAGTSPADDEAVEEESPSEGDQQDVYDDKLSVMLEVLYDEDEVLISDEDVDTSLDRAEEIDPELRELLEAVGVED